MTDKDAIKQEERELAHSPEREHARPTVKDVFALRKQGKIEEAYDAIRPMYAVHKGKYTTLCMFWTAADVFKLLVCSPVQLARLLLPLPQHSAVPPLVQCSAVFPLRP